MGNGRYRPKRHAYSKKKGFKKYFLSTKHRKKDIDQIQDEIKKVETTKIIEKMPFDEDLPGCGQFYCRETGRHFQSQHALDSHKKTKFYKKRLKHLKEEAYTQDEANLGAGMTKEQLPPAHKLD